MPPFLLGFLIGILIGLFIGVFIGIIALSLCIVGAYAETYDQELEESKPIA